MRDGMSPSDAKALADRVGGREAGPLVLPDTLRSAVELAVAAVGQWRMAGGGMAPLRPVAFDFAALDSLARWLGIEPSRALLADLRVIEDEALKIMRGRR